MKIAKLSKRNIAIISSLILLIAVAVHFIHFKSRAATKVTKQPVVVNVYKVKMTTIPSTIQAIGHLDANQKTDVSTKISGYVTQVDFHEGEHVKANQILVQLDNRKEQDDLASAKADAALTQLQYQRDKVLYHRKLILQDVYYNAKVKNEQNQAALKTAITNLSNKTIRAPFAGTVGAETINIGDYVSAGEKMVTLVDSQHLKVEYSLPSHYLGQIQADQTVLINSVANPLAKATAKVSYIAPTIDPDTQMVSIHALLHNDDNQFEPGELINIKQNLGHTSQALLIPSYSLIANINSQYVYTIKNNRAVQTEVVVGARYNGEIIVENGLKPGELVVTAGQNELHNGQTVKVVSTS